jgi:hypothetical protein
MALILPMLNLDHISRMQLNLQSETLKDTRDHSTYLGTAYFLGWNTHLKNKLHSVLLAVFVQIKTV